ncbi:MAG: NYN domain-containing protein [Planctomycetaceae bacterium]|jgi:uncharacterized LabA/DUF88 family protein|nr:NYN domain-containing protein [Planctomycetaceae bacterium]
MQEVKKKIAVLIDGDNAESKLIEQILGEAGKHGKITIKKVYGDFSVSHINKNWSKELCNSYAIRPMQKYSYTLGKNSTDTELIIDAMDILRSHLVEGFCIVSSDSDYTGLANRIREEGRFIMGIGRSKTPSAFVNACEIFIFTEILELPENGQPEKKLEPSENEQPEKKLEETPKQNKTTVQKPDAGVGKRIILTPISSLSGIKPIRQRDIDHAFNMAVNETGLAIFPRFHDALKQSNPTFDYRNFGFNTFRKFCENLSPTYTISIDGATMALKKSE